MFEGIRYQLTLWNLVQAIRRLARESLKRIKEARAAAMSEDEVGRLFMDWIDAERLISDDISQLRTHYLLAEGVRLLIPRPEFNLSGPDWQKSPITAAVQLTTEGQTRLLAAIRAEKKIRSEWWFQWAAALTGVLGTLIGLVAIFKH